MPNPLIDHDRLTNLKVVKGSTAAMAVINALQARPPEEQVVGAMAAFLLIAEAFSVNVQDAASITTHMMEHAAGRRPEFAAVAEYLNNEVVKS